MARKYSLTAVWNTDMDGRISTGLVGLYTKPSPEVGGIYTTSEIRDAIEVDGVVYVVDKTIPPLPINRLDMNLPKVDAEDRKEALALLTPRQRALLGVA